MDPEKGTPVPFVNSGSNDIDTGYKKKVGGRICPVLPHLRGLDFNSDSDPEWASSDDILGKQIEAESGNALQYRTCSWQKVHKFPSSPSRAPITIVLHTQCTRIRS